MNNQHSPLEDWRGVDVGQIRRMLDLTVAERAAEMVETCNMVLQVQENVRKHRERLSK
jgi:hypothetical protein